MANSNNQEGLTVPYNSFGRQESLRKKFGFLSQLGIAFVILTTWTSMAASMNIALPSGGSVAVLYGLILSGFLTMTVALSLAEICSVYPTNGGQYEWTALLSHPSYRRFLSYVCGWTVVASWWALAASGPSLFGNLAISFLELFNTGYVAQRWHEFLFYMSVEVSAFFINTFLTPALPVLSEMALYLSLSGLVGISISLLVLTRHSYQSARFVFTGFINETGWPDGFAWILGLLQSCFSLTAYDAVAHLVEEMPHPQTDAPRTMIIAVALGTLTGFVFCVCVLFSIQDVQSVIKSPHSPIVSIFYQASGSKGGAVGLAIVILIIIWFSASEVVTTSARLTAAFARHHGLPFGSIIAKNNTRLDLPWNAMVLTVAMVTIFGLIYLGTSAAFDAIVSACVVGLNTSYAMPIALLVVRGRQILPQGQFRLGRWGYAINVIALVFLVVTNVLLLFPAQAHTTGSSMNYAIAAIAVVYLFAGIYWYLYAHKHYIAPHIVIDGIESDSDIPQTTLGKAAATEGTK
ncbi:GABA permease gaba [Aspergillus sclerotioniger CBS 115572]|uniref:GABA permease gaba n=1 Tax=Aspergillus sclerotioniger CBS 115572 TaxID=1450535 RepID=A0A317VPU1_9EURO|nr:GABA permease gaba [Aspergillus sclerotioniger CBS 115572]PWY73880.1 GABA permease gaba [Aspergillus sclerotioniger CBS 115572]